MAFLWILFLTILQIFGESTCVSAVNPCEDRRLQYVFFLIPPADGLLELKQYLTKFESVKFLTTSDGYLQVGCDPESWDEIQQYINDRNIYLLHSGYCIEKGAFSTHEELRPRRNTPGKLQIYESPWNLINGERSQGGNTERERNSLKELNVEVLGVLKNGRNLKREETHSQLSIDKNLSRKTRSKNNTGKKRTPPIKPSTQRSAKKPVPVKNPRKKISRRSVIDTEDQKSWIEKAFHRLKRSYSWDLLSKNQNYIQNFYPAKNDLQTINRRAAQDHSTPCKHETMKSTNDGESSPSRTINASKVLPKGDEESEVERRGSLIVERNRRGAEGGATENVPKYSTSGVEGKEEEKEDDLEKEKRRDNDHPKYDYNEHDCLATEVETLQKELASYFHGLFNWIKNLETRGKGDKDRVYLY